MDFVLPNKDESLLDAYHKWRTRATNKVCCDYALHVGIRNWSDEVKYKRLFYKIFSKAKVRIIFFL